MNQELALRTLGFEDLPLLKHLLHGHCRNNDASLTLDDAYHDVLHMVPPLRTGQVLDHILGVSRKQFGILPKCLFLVLGTDGEHSRQGKLQFLDRHRLEIEREVKWSHGDPSTLKPD